MEGADDSTPARRPDPTQMRISDHERHQVAEILREAAGDGRLDLDELDERLEATYAAKTYADLVPITLDLPATAPARPLERHDRAPEIVGTAGHEHQTGVAIMSSINRKGVWVVPKVYTITCMMGGADLDLREARFAAREVVLNISAFMGGANVIVNPRTRVIVEGIGIMGGYTAPGASRRDVPEQLDESSPVVRIRGVAIWGGVDVKRRDVRRKKLGPPSGGQP